MSSLASASDGQKLAGYLKPIILGMMDRSLHCLKLVLPTIGGRHNNSITIYVVLSVVNAMNTELNISMELLVKLLGAIAIFLSLQPAGIAKASAV